jgi:hypothetical protein
MKRLRTEIRVRFSFREATAADADALTEWLRDHAAAEASGEIEAMIERLEARCRELAIELAYGRSSTAAISARKATHAASRVRDEDGRGDVTQRDAESRLFPGSSASPRNPK